MRSASPEQTIRLSLGWIIVIVIAMAALGIIGGLLGSQVVRPPLPPLTADRDRLVTTVQEVTISPNTAVADLVERNHRSIVTLVDTAGEAHATAFAVTSDGLLVTADNVTRDVAARDADGRRLTIDLVGRDELFGLTYFRATNNVVVPLDVRQSDSRVAETLTAISRNETSHAPRAHSYQVREYQLPSAAAPPGQQRLLLGSSITSPHADGTPLLDEEGRVAGLLLDSDNGIALPASELRASFSRVADNQRERNPFADLGFTVNYTFAATDESPAQFVAEIATVTANSPAARAGLQRGDLVTQINDTPLQWNQNTVTALSADLPLSLTSRRNAQTQTRIISQTTTSPTPSPS